MKKLFKMITAILKKYRQHRAWQRVVQVLSCIAVFCTTYALILPAITLENPDCGFLEHEHSLDCYMQHTAWEQQLTCTLEVSAEHEHARECFTMAEIPVEGDVLTCTLEESVDHFHGVLCYGHWELVCQLPVHIHTDACSEPVPSVEETEPSTEAEEVTEPTAETEAEGTEEEETEPTAETEAEETEPEETEPTAETELLELVYSDETVIVTVAYGPEANIPEGAQLVVLPITPEAQSETYRQRLDEAQQVLAEDEGTITTFVLYDIYFTFEDQVIQPDETVSVTVQFLNEEGAVAGTPVSVVHFAEDGTEVLESTDIDESASTTFRTDGFSQYGISLLAEEEEETQEEDEAPMEEGDASQVATPVYPETLPAKQTEDPRLIAYFSFDDTDTGFRSVTTDAAGEKIVNGQALITAKDSENGDLIQLPNGDFDDAGTAENWVLNNYSAVSIDESAENNKTNILKLWLSDDEQSSGSASYTAHLTPGTYYFTFELSGAAMDGGLSYTATAGANELVTGSCSPTTGWDSWTTEKTATFTLTEETDVTFTLSGTQPAGYWGYLDNLQLYGTEYTVTDYIDAEAVGNVGTASGFKGNAAYLDGGNYLDVTGCEGSSLLTGYDAITVSYWSKTTKADKNWGFFAARDDSTTKWNENEYYLGFMENGSYHLEQYHYSRENNQESEAIVSPKPPVSDWHYITAIYSKDKIAMYVDGVKLGEKTADADGFKSPTEILGNDSILQIGKANYNPNEFYQGYIDEFRIYNTALSDGEIADLYESEAKEVRPYQDTLLAHFDFNNIANGFTDAKTGAKATNSKSDRGYYDTDAFHFTGENYLTVTDANGDSLLKSNCEAITVSFWSKPDDPSASVANWGFYAAPDHTPPQNNGKENYIAFAVRNNKFLMDQFRNGRGNNNYYRLEDGTVPEGWHYVTAVYSTDHMALYVDGILYLQKPATDGDFPKPGDILGDTGIFQIGKANWGTGEYYKGYMDEFRIYSSALTETDVAQLYHNEVKKTATYTTARVAPTDFSSLETGKPYLIYTQDADGNYYAIAAKPGDTTGYAVPITFHDDGSFTWPADTMDNFLWTFSDTGNANQYIIRSGSGMHLHAYNNNSAYGTVTGGAYPSTLEAVYDSEGNPDGSFIATGNTYYTGLQINSVASNTGNDIDLSSNIFIQVNKTDAAHLRLATVDYNVVWLDGTDGGLMAYGGSPNELRYCSDRFTLPETWQSPGKYGYTLRGWYDITNSKYYNPGEILTGLDQNLVFYADWVPSTYDYGIPQNEQDIMANTLDTSDFISIEMFDFNALFNVQSVRCTGTVSETGHSETWEFVESGDVPYNNMLSLNFLFRDWDNQFIDISYPKNLNTINDNNTPVTSGIVGSVGSSSPALLDVLFDRYTEVIGKNFVGNANHLFQYVDPDDTLYEGSENPGYYYYDSKYNAASYNQSDQRFYIYNYRERTTDSGKNADSSSAAASSANSDFLPFNSPYVTPEGKVQQTYTIADTKFTFDNYQFDAKFNNDAYNNVSNVIANYNFGMKVNINFFLPNDSAPDGTNRLNQAELGGDMLFGFEGDDDLWVFVDDQLVLDVGGIHGVRSGTINFSTGDVTVDNGTPTNLSFASGDHTLTVYYLERGSSQSNCAIYFNLAPSRYGLELAKKDHDTKATLSDAKFNIYLDPECTQLAPIWFSEDEKNDKPPVTEREGFDGFLVDGNGKLNAWGFVLGKTYYLKETTAPKGYLVTDDVIAFAMHLQGNHSYSEVTVLPGADGRDPGLEVITNQVTRQTVSTQDSLTLALDLTNRKGTTRVTVDKLWEPATIENPPAVPVRLLQNGVLFDTVTLPHENEWTYTWDNLPVTDSHGNKFVYTVEEDVPPGFIPKTEDVSTEIATNWRDVAVLEGNTRYLLTNDGKALTVNSEGSLTWINLEDAKAAGAFWTAETNGSGFLLRFGEYKLTFNEDGSFTASTDDGNQAIYYDGTNLYAVSGAVRHDYSPAIRLLKQEMITAKHYKITNAQGYELPDTGSSLTPVYYSGGLAMIALAVLLERKRRRKYA